MDSTVLASLVGAGATIGAAILGKAGFLDNLFASKKSSDLIGRWDSTWVDIGDNCEKINREDFYITKQKNEKVSGYILKDDEPDKRWEFEGNFKDNFLQIIYYPSKKADSKSFIDYGCYFFSKRGDGNFEGYSVGFAWDYNQVGLSKHQLKLKK